MVAEETAGGLSTAVDGSPEEFKWIASRPVGNGYWYYTLVLVTKSFLQWIRELPGFLLIVRYGYVWERGGRRGGATKKPGRDGRQGRIGTEDGTE